MEIRSPCVVNLTWQMFDAQNASLADLDEAQEFLLGGDDLVATVESALIGLSAGSQAHVALQPEQAFGDYDSALVCFEARELFPPELQEGMQFEGLPQGAQTPDMPTDLLYTVTEIYPEHVVLDGNHPLAGLLVRLHIQVRGVRAATEDELQRRSVLPGVLSLLSGSAARAH